jgi:hypothetical protein
MKSPFGGEDLTWRTALDLGLGLLMLVLAFVGIGASDVSGAGTQGYWSVLAIGFALASYALQWAHAGEGFRHGEAALRMAVHWAGVLAAIQLVHLFIASGRLTNADTGLLEGVILALGTFLCGVHASWRLIVIGLALGLATAAVAYLEQYLWVLFGLAVLALVAILVVARARSAAD